MRQETQTRLVRRIKVTDENGSTHTIEEWGDFLRVQFNEGWSNWDRSGGRFKLGRQTVNPTDDKQGFVVPTTGEILTIATATPEPPDQQPQ